jgi:hypothetical protein
MVVRQGQYNLIVRLRSRSFTPQEQQIRQKTEGEPQAERMPQVTRQAERVMAAV